MSDGGQARQGAATFDQTITLPNGQVVSIETLGYGPVVARCATCGDDMLRDEAHWELPPDSGVRYCACCIAAVRGDLRPGQAVTVWCIEATSEGDVVGPLQGVVLGRETPGNFPVDGCYFVRVTRTDLGGGGPVYEGEYLINEADISVGDAG